LKPRIAIRFYDRRGVRVYGKTVHSEHADDLETIAAFDDLALKYVDLRSCDTMIFNGEEFDVPDKIPRVVMSRIDDPEKYPETKSFYCPRWLQPYVLRFIRWLGR